MRRWAALAMLAIVTACVCVAAAGCYRWPISPEYAKATVRTCMSQRVQVSRLQVGRVSHRNPLAPGRDVYSVKVEFSDQTGPHAQVWAVDAVTGQAFPPDFSAVDSPPGGAF
jgi:hypothetical protein